MEAAPKALSQSRKNNLLAGFAIVVIADIAGKNLHLLVTHPIFLAIGELDYVYWCMESFSFLCYICFIFYCASTINFLVGFPALKIVTMNWIPLALQDFIDEATLHATEVNWIEYAALGVTILITILELKKIKTLLLIKKWLMVMFLTAKRFLLSR